MRDNYGRMYPGSGGATDRPPTGGADWHPLPKGMLDQVPVTKKVVVEHQPGLVGRLLRRATTYTETEVVVGHKVRKNYS